MADERLEQRIKEFLDGDLPGAPLGQYGHLFKFVMNGYRVWEHFKLLPEDVFERRFLVTDGFSLAMHSSTYIYNGQLDFPEGSVILYNRNKHYIGVVMISADGKSRVTISVPPSNLRHQRNTHLSSNNPSYSLLFLTESKTDALCSVDFRA